MFVIFITIAVITFISVVLIFMWVLFKSRKIVQFKCVRCKKFIFNKPAINKKISLCSSKCKKEFEKHNK